MAWNFIEIQIDVIIFLKWHRFENWSVKFFILEKKYADGKAPDISAVNISLSFSDFSQHSLGNFNLKKSSTSAILCLVIYRDLQKDAKGFPGDFWLQIDCGFSRVVTLRKFLESSPALHSKEISGDIFTEEEYSPRLPRVFSKIVIKSL